MVCATAQLHTALLHTIVNLVQAFTFHPHTFLGLKFSLKQNLEIKIPTREFLKKTSLLVT